jgi:hypothetical protein
MQHTKGKLTVPPTAMWTMAAAEEGDQANIQK